ncbi:MAG: hypothetical protein JO015_19485 [Verrucomicrobia bacterium]|nr:hypothetical protein [Verrucomicrobiota bacterium]
MKEANIKVSNGKKNLNETVRNVVTGHTAGAAGVAGTTTEFTRAHGGHGVKESHGAIAEHGDHGGKVRRVKG